MHQVSNRGGVEALRTLWDEEADIRAAFLSLVDKGVYEIGSSIPISEGDFFFFSTLSLYSRSVWILVEELRENRESYQKKFAGTFVIPDQQKMGSTGLWGGKPKVEGPENKSGGKSESVKRGQVETTSGIVD